MAEGDRSDPHAPPRESTTQRLKISDSKDMGLPRTQRNYVLPIVIALIVFALIILVRLLWG